MNISASAETRAENARAGRRIAGQLLACGWCGAEITVASVGRTPKWCSNSCRHRAWETSRAAARGLVAVRVVDRAVAVEVPVSILQRVEVPTNPRGPGWAPALHELAHQLDTGRIYDRDLSAIVDGVEALLASLSRRSASHRPRPRP